MLKDNWPPGALSWISKLHYLNREYELAGLWNDILLYKSVSESLDVSWISNSPPIIWVTSFLIPLSHKRILHLRDTRINRKKNAMDHVYLWFFVISKLPIIQQVQKGSSLVFLPLMISPTSEILTVIHRHGCQGSTLLTHGQQANLDYLTFRNSHYSLPQRGPFLPPLTLGGSGKPSTRL